MEPILSGASYSCCLSRLKETCEGRQRGKSQRRLEADRKGFPSRAKVISVSGRGRPIRDPNAEEPGEEDGKGVGPFIRSSMSSDEFSPSHPGDTLAWEAEDQHQLCGGGTILLIPHEVHH